MEMALHSTKATLKNKKGLTLIELLAVLVIVGIIAAIAIPAINATISKSKTKADAATVQLFEDAVIRWATENDKPTGSKVTDTELQTDGYLTTALKWGVDANKKNTATITVSATGVITVALSNVTPAAGS